MGDYSALEAELAEIKHYVPLNMFGLQCDTLNSEMINRSISYPELWNTKCEAVYALRFRELGKRVFYVTNNSTKHRREYKTKLDKLGFGGSLVGGSLNWDYVQMSPKTEISSSIQHCNSRMRSWAPPTSPPPTSSRLSSTRVSLST